MDLSKIGIFSHKEIVNSVQVVIYRRVGDHGLWKAYRADKDIPITHNGKKVGLKKNLMSFWKRKKTNWIMQEYELSDIKKP